MAIAGSVALTAGWAAACPECKVAAGDLVDEGPSSKATPSTNPASTQAVQLAVSKQSHLKKLRFAAGVDVPTAYFYRGYLQQDRGVIFQPFITLSTTLVDDGTWRVQPYLTSWNSFHTASTAGVPGGHAGHLNSRVEQRTEQYLDPGHAGNPTPHFHNRTVDVVTNSESDAGWFETKLIGGVTIKRKDLTLDLKLHGHAFPDGQHDPVLEAAFKASYDVAGLFDSNPERTYAIRPYIDINRELIDGNGGEETYIELGIDPSFRSTLFGHRVGFSFPVALGMSPDGYFRDLSGNDEALGFLSTSAKASFELPLGWNDTRCFLNASVTGLFLLSDGVEASNRGDDAEIIGSIGISFQF